MSAELSPARLRAMSPEELRAACARLTVSLRLNYNEDLHFLMGLFESKRRFDAGEALSVWRGLAAGGEAARSGVGLYVHVPYCESLCSFCFCSTSVLDNERKLEAWTADIEREIDFFSPALAGVELRSFHVGGGSPSILSAGQLRRALGRCGRSFRWEPDALRSIECNPHSTTPEKLEAMREAGFNRVSFGVQSLNPKVLERIRRGYQTARQVADGVAWARRAGFEEINLDLMFGLWGEDLPSFLEGARRALAWGPETFTVCGVSLTEGYLKENRLDAEAFEAAYDRSIRDALPALRSVAEKAGYRCGWMGPDCGTWTFYSRSCPESVLARTERCSPNRKGPQSILGLGPYSQSRAFGAAWYERTRDSHLGFRLDRPIYAGRRIDLKQEMMRFCLYELQDGGEVSRPRFFERFGVDIETAFRQELSALEALGQVRMETQRVAFLASTPASRWLHAMMLLRDLLPELAARPSPPPSSRKAFQGIHRLKAGEGLS